MAKMAKMQGITASQNPYFEDLHEAKRMNFKIPAVPAHPTLTYHWVRSELVGQADVHNMNDKLTKDPRMQWELVKPGEIPELAMYERDGAVRCRDLVLIKGDKQMAKYKQEYKIALANRQIRDLKQDTMERLKDQFGAKIGQIEDRVEFE